MLAANYLKALNKREIERTFIFMLELILHNWTADLYPYRRMLPDICKIYACVICQGKRNSSILLRAAKFALSTRKFLDRRVRARN